MNEYSLPCPLLLLRSRFTWQPEKFSYCNLLTRGIPAIVTMIE